MKKWSVRIIGFLLLVAALTFAAFKLSPWPSVLVIRHTFDTDTATRLAALEKLRPANIVATKDIVSGNNRFDYFAPKDEGLRPAIFWVHGGAFIAGQKEDVAPYLEILASKGFSVFGIGYTTAPTAKYPDPTRQVAATIAQVLADSTKYGLDSSKIFLAGDSAGSQIASHVAAISTDPAYASATGITAPLKPEQIKGIILNCGFFDPSKINLDGAFGGFIRTVLWSYFGTADLSKIEKLDEFNITKHISPAFPPAFLTVGNGDPLAGQTKLMAEALKAKGVATDELYFADDYQPPLPHEYQFNLDSEAGKTALNRILAFLRSHQ